MTTPENVTGLAPGEVFVFGSNLSGHHAGGAAKTAYEKFGAVWGFGEGSMGSSYAFPTLDYDGSKFPYHFLERSRSRFYMEAVNNPEKTFLLTKVGCGIAGYDEEDMKNLFKVKLSNVTYPHGW